MGNLFVKQAVRSTVYCHPQENVTVVIKKKKKKKINKDLLAMLITKYF